MAWLLSAFSKTFRASRALPKFCPEPCKDEKAEYVAEMEEIHADFERRNRYLKGELVRRDSEKAARVGRPWWKWWKK